MTINELKGKISDVMKGDLTLTKLDFFLIAAIMLLAGICIGFLAAPLTHGVSVLSNNGSNNGNNNGNNSAGHAEDEGEER